MPTKCLSMSVIFTQLWYTICLSLWMEEGKEPDRHSSEWKPQNPSHIANTILKTIAQSVGRYRSYCSLLLQIQI